MDIKDYRVTSSHAAMRDKLYDILDFAIRGEKCNREAAADERNPIELREYHTGKAQAFAEIVTFFDYAKRNKEHED